MNIQQLAGIAKALVEPGKGVLAADEGPQAIKRRFSTIDVESTEENRRSYRELIFRTPAIAKYISGVILYDETIRQDGSDGTPLVKVLADQSIIPGIKVDNGAKDLTGAPGEQVTEGLDGLRERLVEYREMGARFTKWRAVINIDAGIPSRYCIDVNAHALARFAALSQEAGMVPIVEPEVMMDGGHSIDRCEQVTEDTLREVFYALGHQGVALEGILLKPNMVLSGKSAATRACPDEVGEKTIACFKRVLPAAVPGVVFLSGGQSDDEATINLNAINRQAAAVGAPWPLSFSFGRALQSDPLKAWAGRSDNIQKAQRAFHHRSRLNSASQQGAYTPAMKEERAAI